MASSTSEVRTAVTNAIDALSGWTPSRYAPEAFGSDADQLMHHSFSVAVTDTTPIQQRQRVPEGLMMQSTVEVRWAHRLRGDAQSADYNAALDAEATMAGAVMAVLTKQVLNVTLARESRAEGWVIGLARFTVLHRLALT